MPEDIHYPDGYYDVVMKLEHEERERIQKLMEEHHNLKTDYERRYHLQVDNVNMGNRKFQEKQKLMRPYDYAKQLDKKLMLEARTSLQKQRDLEQRMKAERERRAANQNKEKSGPANDNHPTKQAFREQMKETSGKQAEPVKPANQQKDNPTPQVKPEKSEKDIDPRRLEFRREMDEINRQNEKDRDKGLDKEI